MSPSPSTGWPTQDEILAAWIERETITAEQAQALADWERPRAFWLADNWDTRFVADIQASLEGAQRAGLTFADWLPEAQRLLAAYGSTATVYRGGQEWPTWYADLVFRNAVQSGLAGGRYADMFSPQGIQEAPFVMYRAIHDFRTRPEHAALDGRVFRKTDAAARHYFPPWEHNCFPGDTPVRGVFDGASKAVYTGDMIRIETRRGNTLTVTTNHPVATEFGMTAAHLLSKGDRLLCYPGRIKDGLDADRANEAVVRILWPDKARVASPREHVQNRPAEIGELYESIKLAGSYLRVPVRSNDFHGDASAFDGDIEVAAFDGELLHDLDTKSPQGGCNLVLSPVDVLGSLESSLGSLAKTFPGIIGPPPGLPGSGALARDSGGVGFDRLPLQRLRSAPASDLDSRKNQPMSNRRAGDVQKLRKGQFRLPGVVSLDEIVDVQVHEVTGLTVFDLQSPHGWILAGNIYTSNCRCFLRELDLDQMQEGGYQLTDGALIQSLPIEGGVVGRPGAGWDRDQIDALVPAGLRRP